jgi:TIR domain
VKLFVSYRREDSQDMVSRLCDRLEGAFGSDAVFVDVDSISIGGGFMGAVAGAIVTSDVRLVVIGPTWSGARDARGRRRLDDKDDPVRMEVGLCLAQPGPTVPLLVDGASMPTKHELPRALRLLVSLNGFRLGAGEAMEHDIATLIEHLGGPSAPGSRPSGERRPRRNASWSTFEGRWQARDGGMSEIVQSSGSIQLRGAGANGVEFQGEGRVDGRRAVLDCVNSIGLRGRLLMELTPDGGYINGHWQGATGTALVQMMRRS